MQIRRVLLVHFRVIFFFHFLVHKTWHAFGWIREFCVANGIRQQEKIVRYFKIKCPDSRQIGCWTFFNRASCAAMHKFLEILSLSGNLDSHFGDYFRSLFSCGSSFISCHTNDGIYKLSCVFRFTVHIVPRWHFLLLATRLFHLSCKQSVTTADWIFASRVYLTLSLRFTTYRFLSKYRRKWYLRLPPPTLRQTICLCI